MQIVVLAVTNAFNRFCIAGMTENGNWVRPVPQKYKITLKDADRFWDLENLIFKDYGFIRAGDVLSFDEDYPLHFMYSNHKEDMFSSNLKISERLANDQLIKFLEINCEDKKEFNRTVNAKGRSLCLARATDFINYVDDRGKPRIRFTSDNYPLVNPQTSNHTVSGNFPVKDCKWVPFVQKQFVGHLYRKIYFCVGLATPFNGIEYPMAVGIHTDPPIRYENNYPA